MFTHTAKPLHLQFTEQDRAAIRKLGRFMGIRRKTLPVGGARAITPRQASSHPVHDAPLSTILRTCLQRAAGSPRFRDQLARRLGTGTVPPGPLALRPGPGRPPQDGRPKLPPAKQFTLNLDPAEHDALVQRARDCAHTSPSNYVYATLNLMIAALKRDGVWGSDEDVEDNT